MLITAYRYYGESIGNINPGSGTIWLDQVSCRGTETDIVLCPHNTWGSHDCGHHEDVSVRCTAPTVTGIIKIYWSLIHNYLKYCVTFIPAITLANVEQIIFRMLTAIWLHQFRVMSAECWYCNYTVVNIVTVLEWGRATTLISHISLCSEIIKCDYNTGYNRKKSQFSAIKSLYLFRQIYEPTPVWF